VSLGTSRIAATKSAYSRVATLTDRRYRDSLPGRAFHSRRAQKMCINIHCELATATVFYTEPELSLHDHAADPPDAL